MSLLDTIKGAREEAESAGTLIGASKKADDASAGGTKEGDKPRGGTRRSSAASARPARELAGSVRNASDAAKPKEKMTSEEKRAARNERRREEDIIYDAKKAALDAMPEYKRTQRIWWGMLIGGIALTLISYAIIRSASDAGQGSDNIAMLSVAMMAGAYVLVIGAFIFDLVKVRPLRKKADQQLSGMTKKRMVKFVEEEERRKAEEKAKAKK